MSMAEIPKVYFCRKCQKWYRKGNSDNMCLVLHQPGDCCHYGHTEIEEPQ